MRAGRLFVIALFCAPMAVGNTALACECGLKFPIDRAAEATRLLREAQNIVLARVIAARQTREVAFDGNDGLIVARLEIVRLVRGRLPKHITVASEGYDNGGNCGYGNALVRARLKGSPIALVISGRKVRGYYYFSGCEQGLQESDLPAPD